MSELCGSCDAGLPMLCTCASDAEQLRKVRTPTVWLVSWEEGGVQEVFDNGSAAAEYFVSLSPAQRWNTRVEERWLRSEPTPPPAEVPFLLDPNLPPLPPF